MCARTVNMYKKKRGGVTYKGSGGKARKGGVTYKGSGSKRRKGGVMTNAAKMKLARPLVTAAQKALMKNKMIARNRLMMKKGRGMKGGNFLKTLGSVAETVLPIAAAFI